MNHNLFTFKQCRVQGWRGFSLVELMIAIGIMAILISIVYVSFQESRMSTRDQVRQTTLADLQLAIETFRAQTGVYPAQGCGMPGTWATNGAISGLNGTNCGNVTFINSLVPSYINSLPNPNRPEGMGFAYRSDQNAYKLIVFEAVESSGNFISSFNDRFAVCPPEAAGQPGGLCAETVLNSGIPVYNRTYAVYSAGAESW